MSGSFRCVLLLSASILVLTGCGRAGGDDVSLAPAQGTVTYKGAPLGGATVVFLPDKGPTASGLTDSTGVFKLTSGGRPGAAVGKSKVTITKGDPSAAPKGPMKPEDMMKIQKGEVAAPETKSLVPPIYGSPDSTPLNADVLPDGNKNKFQFDLVD